LFLPLKQLESRTNRQLTYIFWITRDFWLTRFLVNDLTFQEAALYSHLVDILTFFIRQHVFRSQGFMHEEFLAPKVAQLLTVSQKHLKLGQFRGPTHKGASYGG
jgi:protein phosphatase-4 regulatory subunit 3